MSRVLKLGPPFDPGLLDILDGKTVDWSSEVWRIVLEGSDPLVANARGARWNSSDFEAVYFSLDPHAAHAELDYLLGRQPVPIRKQRRVYRFEVSLSRLTLFFSSEEWGRATS